MQILPLSPETLAQALDTLRAGGIVAHATETCYGLACDLRNPAAVARLFAVKQRPDTQPVSALFRDVAHAKEYVIWNSEAEKLAEAFLPGPLTLILPLRSDAPHTLLPCPTGHATIGVRISSHPVAQDLIQQYALPLSTTSANVHGLPSPYSADTIAEQFASCVLQPDLVLDCGPLPPVPPSKIIDLTAKGKILRS